MIIIAKYKKFQTIAQQPGDDSTMKQLEAAFRVFCACKWKKHKSTTEKKNASQTCMGEDNIGLLGYPMMLIARTHV